MKWVKLKISGYIPKGAILQIGDHLVKVMRRKPKEGVYYVDEYKPIVIKKSS